MKDQRRTLSYGGFSSLSLSEGEYSTSLSFIYEGISFSHRKEDGAWIFTATRRSTGTVFFGFRWIHLDQHQHWRGGGFFPVWKQRFTRYPGQGISPWFFFFFSFYFSFYFRKTSTIFDVEAVVSQSSNRNSTISHKSTKRKVWMTLCFVLCAMCYSCCYTAVSCANRLPVYKVSIVSDPVVTVQKFEGTMPLHTPCSSTHHHIRPI
ncbi:hypothetical protein QBC35DRAFT_158639 [Podospora australis]|uniref:Uncharacterized protein n=1 Tax=Podospora australis TaxID=1536484 RepID=A0AAN7AMT6_9PEZI|nr:hypothetical protein QBC35DRAFT_158639 [Podospora australis]